MEISIWKNKRNEKKIIVLKKYECNHWYWAQFIDNGDNRQWMGCLFGRRHFSRVSCATWRPVLEQDYECIKKVEEGGEW